MMKKLLIATLMGITLFLLNACTETTKTEAETTSTKIKDVSEKKCQADGKCGEGKCGNDPTNSK